MWRGIINRPPKQKLTRGGHGSNDDGFLEPKANRVNIDSEIVPAMVSRKLSRSINGDRRIVKQFSLKT